MEDRFSESVSVRGKYAPTAVRSKRGKGGGRGTSNEVMVIAKVRVRAPATLGDEEQTELVYYFVIQSMFGAV